MACNWLMMTSFGDDNRPSGSLGLLTDKTKKKNRNKPKAEQETAQPTAARFNKLKVNLKPRTPAAARLKINRLPSINRPAYGCAVNKLKVNLKPRTPAAARLTRRLTNVKTALF